MEHTGFELSVEGICYLSYKGQAELTQKKGVFHLQKVRSLYGSLEKYENFYRAEA